MIVLLFILLKKISKLFLYTPNKFIQKKYLQEPIRMKSNRSEKIKYVPKQVYNKLNAPFTIFLNLILFL